jgi:hypothetical protein
MSIVSRSPPGTVCADAAGEIYPKIFPIDSQKPGAVFSTLSSLNSPITTGFGVGVFFTAGVCLRTTGGFGVASTNTGVSPVIPMTGCRGVFVGVGFGVGFGEKVGVGLGVGSMTGVGVGRGLRVGRGVGENPGAWALHPEWRWAWRSE